MKKKLSPGVWILMALVFVVTLGAAFVASQYIRSQEQRQAEKLLSNASETLQDRVQAELDQQTNAVLRLASKWNVRPDLSRVEWEYDVRQITEDHKSLLALGWIENPIASPQEGAPAKSPEDTVRDWEITWTNPPVYEPAVFKLHSLVKANRLALLAGVIKERRMKITDPIDVADRGKAFAAYAPSIVDGKIKGAVIGIFHMQVLMDSVFDKILSTDYSLQLTEGYKVIYSRGLPKNRASDWEHLGDLKFFTSNWQMRLWPNPDLQRQNERMAMSVLLGGALLSCLLVGLIFFTASRGEVSSVAVIPEKKGESGEVRRKIEDRLRVWEAAVSNVQEAIFVAESEKVMGSGNPVLFVNDAFTKLTGITSTEIVGKTPKQLFSTGVGAKSAELFRSIVQGEKPAHTEITIQRRGEADLPVEMWMKPVVDGMNHITHWVVILREKAAVVAPLVQPVEQREPETIIREIEVTKEVTKEVIKEVFIEVPAMGTVDTTALTQSLLEGLLADTPLAVQVVDAAGNVVSWNRLAEETTGYSAAELVGKLTPIRVTAPEPGVWHQQSMKSRRKDGSRLDLQVWTAPLIDRENTREQQDSEAPQRQVTRWMSFMADITKEKLAQEELERREAQFRMLVENASDVLAILDLDSTVQYINPAVQAILGMAPEDLIGKKTTDLVQASDAPAAFKALEEARLGQGSSRPKTLHVRHQDGSLREIESVMTFIQGTNLAVMNARDVTGRSRSEMPEVSPAWFLNSVQDAIITYDTEYRVIWMNRAAEDLYNISSAFAQGKTLTELQPDWLQVPSREQIRESLDEQGFWKGEISNYTPAGKEIVQDVSITATYDSEKRRIGAVAIHRDITEKKSALDALAVDEKTKTLTALGTSDGLWDWNIRTDEVYFSPRWKAMAGYGDDEIAGDMAEWYMLVHKDDLSILQTKVDMHLKGVSDHLEAEYRIRAKDGSYRWMMTRAMAMRNTGGEATRLVGLQMDIHEQKDMEEQLLFEAFHDSTTGLANRALFLDRVNGLIARRDTTFAVAFMDLEKFATVNETLGTRGGDKALAEAGRRITECLPKESFVARHGSDEFVALVRTAEEGKLRELGDLLRYQLAKPFEYQGKQVAFKLNVGFAPSTSKAYSAGEDMLQDASRAMAAAKTGKLDTPVYSKAAIADVVEEQLSDASDLEREMRHALEHGGFRVFYHPIITLDTGEIAGVEALLRWQHPERGLLTPRDFLAVAEASGFVLELDRWMMREACLKSLELNHRFRRAEPLVLTVNLSSLHFAEEEFTRKLEAILEETEINPRCMRIELNEKMVLQNADPEEMARNLGRLSVQLNVDDYHDNGDSLQQFDRLPIDRVKLDSSLVRGLATGRNVEKVRSIIGMAKARNLQVVAEGVETLEQLAVLRELKCHLAQGFYFTMPASANDTERLLARSPRW
jgi:diguanylate cyclase (GGDEF)-like protein/PAS domain S-box-containing protein